MTTTFDAIPRWAHPVDLHAGADGGAFVETRYGDLSLWVGDDELPLVELIDGRLSLTELAERGLALEPPLTPERTVALIHGLELAGLIEILTPEGATHTAARARVAGRQQNGWPIPGAKRVSELGRRMPANAWHPAAGAALVAATMVLAYAASFGSLTQLLSPLPVGLPATRSLLLFVVGASFTLTLRSVAGAWVLRSLAHPAAVLTLSLRWVLPHVQLMQRARRRLPQDHRLTLALVGLGASATAAAGWGALSLSGCLWAQPLSAASWLLLAVHLAPHWRTDARTALGAATRLPGLAMSAVLFSRQLPRPSYRSAAPDPARRIVALTATLLVLHSLVLLYALVFVVVPDTLHRAVASLLLQPSAPTPWYEQTLATAIAVVVVVALLVLWAALLVNALRSVVALLTPAPRQAVAVGQGDSQASEWIQQSVAFRALLGSAQDDLTPALVASVQQLVYAPNDVVSAAGQAAPGVGVVMEGELVVLEQDIAGVPFVSGQLRSGDLVGVEHLSPFLPAPWLLRATTTVRLAMLPPAVAVTTIAGGKAAMVLAVLTRHTALASTPLGRLPMLLEFSRSLALQEGGALAGSPQDALWIVLSGRLVLPGNDAEPAREFASPMAVGSFARQVLSAEQLGRLRAGAGGAEVVALPASAIRTLLRESFRSGTRSAHRTRHTLAALRLQTGSYESTIGERP